MPRKVNLARRSGHIKNHVTSVSSTQQRQLQSKFGISTPLVIKALTGDLGAMKLLGTMGMEGKVISDNAEVVRAAAIAAIQGGQDLNQVMSDIYVQAGVSGVAIEKAVNAAALGDKKTANALEEIKDEFDIRMGMEVNRHQNNQQLAVLKAWIEQTVATVDARNQYERTRLSLERRQMTSDISHQKELGKTYLKEGDLGQEKYLPPKQYPGQAVVDKFVEFVRGF